LSRGEGGFWSLANLDEHNNSPFPVWSPWNWI